MPRASDSGQLDLHDIFLRVQHQMLAQLSVAHPFEHASAAGSATEHHWIYIFPHYLPKPTAPPPPSSSIPLGRRSRQIDIAIFDHLYSPALFPHASGVHVPAESVYAVFEIKPTFSRQWLRDAADKAASVRDLHRTTPNPQPILAGLLAAGSVWTPLGFAANLQSSLQSTPLDIGCCLEYGAFEQTHTLRISSPDESLIFFVLRLLERLRAMGPAPAIDLMQYARGLQSFK